MIGSNWAGTYTYRASRLHRAGDASRSCGRSSRGAPRIRVLGSRHSFNDIADSDELVVARARCRPTSRSTGRHRHRAARAVRYGELAEALAARGSRCTTSPRSRTSRSPGAVATATHGSGDGNGNLATAVAALELVTSDGRARARPRAATADFDGLVVGLGALGAVTRLTLDVEPAYEVRQRVFEGLAWDALFEHFDAITRRRLQRQRVHALGRGRRPGVGQEPRRPQPDELFGARAGDRRAPPDPRPRPGQLHGAARRPRAVVGPPAALPHGLHAERRRGDPVRVPRRRARTRSPRSRPCARSADVLRPVLQVSRDPHDRRRPRCG